MSGSRGAVAGLVLLPALATLWVSIHLRPVVDMTEERVGITSREMWRKGEWILPTMNGKLRLEKPPLAYWLPEAWATVQGGYDIRTLRVPFVLLALGTLLFTSGLGRALAGPAGALSAPLVLLSMPLFQKVARRALTDGALMFSVAGAWYLAIRLRNGPSRPHALRLAFGLLLGLSVLAKGPAGLVWVLAPLAVEALCRRSRAPLAGLFSLPGLALFLALALAWPLAVLWRLSGTEGQGPGGLWISEVTGKLGMGTVGDRPSTLHHPEPWHFYLARLAPFCGIWGPVLYLSLAHALCRWPRAAPAAVEERRPALFWFFVPLVILSAVPEKKAEYLTPMLPAAALLVAWLVARVPLRRPQPASLVVAIGLVSSIVFPLLDLRKARKGPPGPPWHVALQGLFRPGSFPGPVRVLGGASSGVRFYVDRPFIEVALGWEYTFDDLPPGTIVLVEPEHQHRLAERAPGARRPGFVLRVEVSQKPWASDRVQVWEKVGGR